MDPKPFRCKQCEAGRRVASAPSRGSRTTDCEEGAPGGQKEKNQIEKKTWKNKYQSLGKTQRFFWLVWLVGRHSVGSFAFGFHPPPSLKKNHNTPEAKKALLRSFLFCFFFSFLLMGQMCYRLVCSSRPKKSNMTNLHPKRLLERRRCGRRGFRVSRAARSIGQQSILGHDVNLVCIQRACQMMDTLTIRVNNNKRDVWQRRGNETKKGSMALGQGLISSVFPSSSSGRTNIDPRKGAFYWAGSYWAACFASQLEAKIEREIHSTYRWAY